VRLLTSIFTLKPCSKEFETTGFWRKAIQLRLEMRIDSLRSTLVNALWRTSERLNWSLLHHLVVWLWDMHDHKYALERVQASSTRLKERIPEQAWSCSVPDLPLTHTAARLAHPISSVGMCSDAPSRV
jgi:hypothetical protein